MPPQINALESNNESPEKRKLRLLEEEQKKMREAPQVQELQAVNVNGNTSTIAAPTAQQQPNPNAIDPQQAFMAGYERSKTDHYLQGFIGACIIIGGGYLGYRGVKWAWSACKSSPAPPPRAITIGGVQTAVGYAATQTQ